MQLGSDSFNDGDYIPTQYALGKTSADGKIDLSDNKSPHLAWSDLPKGTKSIAILCIDKEGRMVPSDLPRADFSHWVLVDLAPDATVAEGAFSDAVTAKGKDGPEGPQGTRCGINDYTGWFAGDPDMAGDYYGYDGPCPPFNDSIVHHYRFTVYALDADRVAVDGRFTAGDVRAAIEGHVLGEASLVAKYKINQTAREL
ncbi:MAG: YbhB/YbcL family Raf kinase inhibitor-like protein [Deltaproteobacteria bacterium]|nr:YbhB/YbcL family Raf kinase inhibitor-like protein [Deltaproteobacteria bacterium]